jgi:hypothetical protein
MRASTRTQIARISGHGQASQSAKVLARKLGHRETRLLTGATLLDGIVKVDTLARVLTRGIELATAIDGRLDLPTVAMHVLQALRPNAGPQLERLVTPFVEVLKRGIGATTQKTGRLDTPDLAAWLLREMTA